jgi:hypothetical protein
MFSTRPYPETDEISPHSHIVYLLVRSILILLSHIPFDLRSVLSTQVSPKILRAFLIFYVCSTYPDTY